MTKVLHWLVESESHSYKGRSEGQGLVNLKGTREEVQVRVGGR